MNGMIDIQADNIDVDASQAVGNLIQTVNITVNSSGDIIFADNKNYLEKANDYFNLPVPDYGACVNYLRKHFENTIKDFCVRQRLGVNVAANQDITEIPSKSFWNAISSGQAAAKWPGLSKALLDDVELYRTFILNPYSHANSTAAYKSEIQLAISSVEALEVGLAAIK